MQDEVLHFSVTDGACHLPHARIWPKHYGGGLFVRSWRKMQVEGQGMDYCLFHEFFQSFMIMLPYIFVFLITFWYYYFFYSKVLQLNSLCDINPFRENNTIEVQDICSKVHAQMVVKHSNLVWPIILKYPVGKEL